MSSLTQNFLSSLRRSSRCTGFSFSSTYQYERHELSGTTRFLGQFATSAIAVITVSSVAGQSEGKSAPVGWNSFDEFRRDL